MFVVIEYIIIAHQSLLYNHTDSILRQVLRFPNIDLNVLSNYCSTEKKNI